MLIKYHPNMLWLIMSRWQQKEKNISSTGSNDMWSITLTLCKSHNGTILTFQLFTKDKQQDCYQILIFLTVFPCHTMKNTETEIIPLINDVLVQCVKERKKRKPCWGMKKACWYGIQSRHNQLQKLKTPLQALA